MGNSRPRDITFRCEWARTADSGNSIRLSKARSILATKPDLIVTANPGCLMQIANSLEKLGSPIPMAHTATVLDASIRGLPVESLLNP